MGKIKAEHIDVWAVSVHDEPGALAAVLKGLREAGANLDVVIARRSMEHKRGVAYVTPLRTDKEKAAADKLGFNITNSVHSVRIEGDNEPGRGAEICEKIAAAGINLRGLSAAVTGSTFVAVVGLDSADDAKKVVDLLNKG